MLEEIHWELLQLRNAVVRQNADAPDHVRVVGLAQRLMNRPVIGLTSLCLDSEKIHFKQKYKVQRTATYTV